MPHLLLSLALLACAADHPADDSGPLLSDSCALDSADDTGDVGELTLDFTDIQVDVLPTGTSALVRWNSSLDSLGAVRLDDGTTSAWEDESSDVHSVGVVGLLPDATVTIELLASTEQGVVVSEPVSFETGSLSADLPRPEIETPGETAPGYRLFAIFDALGTGQQARVLAVDADGHVVWEQVLGPDQLVGSVVADLPRGRLLISTGLQIQALDLVDGSVELLPGNDFHHDLTVLSDGTIASPAQRTIEREGNLFIVDDIVELDLDGVRHVVKDAEQLLDDLGLDPLELMVEPNPAGLDLMHANTIDYDPVNDRYLVGLPGIRTLVGIQRGTGQLDFALGYTTPTQMTADPVLTHQVDVVDDHILWFVNQSEDDPCARIVELSLDDGTFVEQDRWPLDRCESILGLGGVQAMPEGHRLITWAHLGTVEEVDADGTVVQRLTFDPGLAVGYAGWTPSLQPTLK